jgi:hypothetical protein
LRRSVREILGIVTIKDDEAFSAMQARLADLLPRLNELDRRAAMATEAKSWGCGGISAVQRATSAWRSTIWRDLVDLTDDVPEGSGHRSGTGGCARYFN